MTPPKSRLKTGAVEITSSETDNSTTFFVQFPMRLTFAQTQVAGQRLVESTAITLRGLGILADPVPQPGKQPGWKLVPQKRNPFRRVLDAFRAFWRELRR